MALIKCPECGKEISDKANACPNCGCPLGKTDSEVITQTKHTKKSKWIFVIIGLIIVVVAITRFSIYKASTQKEENYQNALDLLNKGKYDEALNIYSDIPQYKDVPEIVKQAKFESYGYSAVKALKSILKNPDSVSIYDIYFYNTSERADESESESESEQPETESNTEPPCIVMYYGAQNGFGGNTTGYVACTYSSDQDTYVVDCVTPTLDKEELDEDDEDYIDYLFSTVIIKGFIESRENIGDINFERFTNVIKNMAYTSVKIIE